MGSTSFNSSIGLVTSFLNAVFTKLAVRYEIFSQQHMSRRVSLLAVILLIAHFVNLAVSNFFLAKHSSWIRLGGYNYTVTAAIGVLVLLLILSWLEARRNREARWLGYFFVVLYGTLVIVVCQYFGTTSTPYLAVFPIGTLVIGLFLDEKMGLFAFAYGLLLIVVISKLELHGVIDYAPAFLDPSLHAQRTFAWFGGMYVTLFLIFLSMLFVAFVAVARRNFEDDVILESSRLLEKNKVELEARSNALQKYAPPVLVEKMLLGEDLVQEISGKIVVTTLMVELTLSRRMNSLAAQSLVSILSDYFSKLIKIVENEGGTVSELRSDGMLVLFGASGEKSLEEQACSALHCAVSMQKKIAEIGWEWGQKGLADALQFRIGMNTGSASVGNFGSVDRMVYTAIGQEVNLAAHLMSHAALGEIVVSESTWRLQNNFPCAAQKQLFLMKGLTLPIAAYRLTPQN